MARTGLQSLRTTLLSRSVPPSVRPEDEHRVHLGVPSIAGSAGSVSPTLSHQPSEQIPMLQVVRTAQTDDLGEIIDILAESSAWLRSKGIVQWPERFSPDQLLPTLDAGDLFVVDDGSALAATVTLQWSDPMFWGDRTDAGFLHRMGVRRSHAGLGIEIMQWASAQVLARGRRYLCLDCLSTNHRLRQYYEDHGYSVIGELAGPTGHAHSVAHGSWTAILYEKALNPE